MRAVKLAPSILSADFGRLAEQLEEAEKAGADLIHVDVMDGHFVPNITIGPVVVAAVRKYTSLPLDVHLMISNPEDYIGAFAAAGSDYLTVHLEATAHVHSLVQQIRGAGAKPGVAINPGSGVAGLESIISDLDLVTVMSVNPGFGGQTFIPRALDKIKAVRDLVSAGRADVEIEVDGGVTTENVREVIRAGADIVVAGSAVFGTASAAEAVKSFLALMEVGREEARK